MRLWKAEMANRWTLIEVTANPLSFRGNKYIINLAGFHEEAARSCLGGKPRLFSSVRFSCWGAPRGNSNIYGSFQHSSDRVSTSLLGVQTEPHGAGEALHGTGMTPLENVDSSLGTETQVLRTIPFWASILQSECNWICPPECSPSRGIRREVQNRIPWHSSWKARHPLGNGHLPLSVSKDPMNNWTKWTAIVVEAMRPNVDICSSRSRRTGPPGAAPIGGTQEAGNCA